MEVKDFIQFHGVGLLAEYPGIAAQFVRGTGGVSTLGLNGW
jgi:succinate dehydrogenase/fumarate reductase flavoprotein subunit